MLISSFILSIFFSGLITGSATDAVLSLLVLLSKVNSDNNNNFCDNHELKSSLFTTTPGFSFANPSHNLLKSTSSRNGPSPFPLYTEYPQSLFSPQNLEGWDHLNDPLLLSTTRDYCCDIKAENLKANKNYFRKVSFLQCDPDSARESMDRNLSPRHSSERDSSQHSPVRQPSCQDVTPANLKTVTSIATSSFKRGRKVKQSRYCKKNVISWMKHCDSLPGCGISSWLFADTGTSHDK